MPRDPSPPPWPGPPPAAPLKGRGTPIRIAHRFERDEREAWDDGWGSLDQQATLQALPPATQVTHERARSALSHNESPDLPFQIGLNPYRGCEHGCIYCYARPTHSYLNLSPGLDFETRIVAKTNLADCLRDELARPGYRPQPLFIGTATDAYQPVERRLRITRAVIELLADCRHPFHLISKSAGIERDLDLIAPEAAAGRASASISLTTLDAPLCRLLEPRAAAPARRLLAVRRLADAGVPVGVNVAPIIPFVNEPEIEQLVAAAAQAGARSVHYTVLRLPWEVNPLFQQWLEQHLPQRAARVMARVREMRGGRDYEATFGARMKGQGVWAELVRQRVEKAAARCGLTRQTPALDCTQFRPPGAAGQGRLF